MRVIPMSDIIGDSDYIVGCHQALLPRSRTHGGEHVMELNRRCVGECMNDDHLADSIAHVESDLFERREAFFESFDNVIEDNELLGEGGSLVRRHVCSNLFVSVYCSFFCMVGCKTY